MNNSNSSLRRQAIIDALNRCDSPHARELLLLDKVIELQDTLFELQQMYAELSLSFKRLQCVQVPF